MKCKAARTSLLGQEQLDQPPPKVAGHLAECVACRDWLQQLVQMERHVPILPVPKSSAKAQLVNKILTSPAPVTTPASRPVPEEPGWVRHERRLKRLALASALTAALVVVAVGLWIWSHSQQGVPVVNHKSKPVEDPFLAHLMQRNLSLAAAKTPRQRVETLADLADDLHSEAMSVAAVAEAGDLTALATLYQRVIREGILPQAKAVPLAERAAILQRIADRLGEVAQSMDHVADQAFGSSVRALRDIASAAREGDKQLRILMQEAKS